MRILAFESSAKAASAAILADGSLLGEAYLHTGLTHSRTLLQLAEHLLVSCGLTTGEIDAAACAAGSGGEWTKLWNMKFAALPRPRPWPGTWPDVWSPGT